MTLKLHILAVGRLKAGPERTLCEDYLERARVAGRSCGIAAIDTREVDESRLGTAAERMAKEALGLISALPPKASTIVLDERGRALSSTGFSDLLKNHLNRGTSDLAFMIGGPDGHGQAIRDSAGFIVSLGAMTWPHRLVRTMLSEQIYRAVTILVNHPYHRP